MDSSSSKPVVVIGAGPAGLGAAYWLAKSGKSVIVLEKEPRVGGMGASVRVGDYVADYGPHTFHLKDTIVTELFNELVGEHCNRVKREAQVWLHGKVMPFPLQVRDVARNLSPFLTARIGADYLKTRTLDQLSRHEGDEEESFESWGRYQFGDTLYRLAFGNYSEKMWGLPGSELSSKLAKQKLTGLNLRNLALSTLGLLREDKAKALGLSREALYDAYPRYGIGSFFESLAAEITKFGGQLLLETTPKEIRFDGDAATEITYEKDGSLETLEISDVVSTIPLPVFSTMLPPSQFSAAQDAGREIKYRSLLVVHLALNKASFSKAHWIYLLDERLIANRLSEQKNLSEDSCPPDQTVLCLDITCGYDDYLWKANDSFLIGLAINDLSVMGLHPRTIRDAFVLRAPNVYPIYTVGFEKYVDTMIDSFAKTKNVFSIGRHGLLLNNDMHDSIEMGFMAAQAIVEGKAANTWYETAKRYIRERLEGYVKDPIKFESPSKS